MKPRSVLVLAVLGVASLSAGWFLGVAPTRVAEGSVTTGTLAFPGLGARLQDAARVEIEHAGKTMVIERHGARWGMADRGDYPVVASKLRGLLTGLTGLRLVERRTDDPKLLPRLGLGDPTKSGTTADLLRVVDAHGKPLAELVLGHRRVHAEDDLPEDIYVRRPKETQSWLAQGPVEVDDDPSVWLDRDIADIAPDRIVAVSVTRGGTRLDFARKGDTLVLTAPTVHPKLDPGRLDDVAGAYQALTLTDVRPGKLPGTVIGHSVFRTKDGMTIAATVSRDGKTLWASFAPTGNAAAQKLAHRVDGWAYELGSWKEAALVPSLDDLKADTSAPAATAPLTQ